ncbi:hypothetical protein LOK49_LG07G00933 [Camellia lanceoleosa]|uniref:Uncharacterized protein n=1 Tax=Camellia lanceoleosa TaxID=1840588 RepID=A0ACC0H959_9ERIC|nr:hypothetical protein LOK49_LG07G00933 [Camellia lanceoleosa]
MLRFRGVLAFPFLYCLTVCIDCYLLYCTVIKGLGPRTE